MKLTKSQLKKIIKEELDNMMNEEDDRCERLREEHIKAYASMYDGDNPFGVRDIPVIEKEAEELQCAWWHEFVSQGRNK
jgi:hypothetical protein